MKKINSPFPILCVALGLFLACSDDRPVIESSFTDPRDNQVYKTIQAGRARWMAEDLQFNNKLSYSYQQALGSCPPGWSLPSEEDWFSLVSYFGGYVHYGQRIGDPEAAYRQMKEFFNVVTTGFYWTSTPAWDDAPSIRSAEFHFFNNDEPEYGASLITGQAHCRCIKRPREETLDFIQFRRDQKIQRYDFYPVQQPGSPDAIIIYLHRELEEVVLLDRAILYATLPDKPIDSGDPPVQAGSAALTLQYNETVHQESYFSNSPDGDFILELNFFDGSRVAGTFSGMGLDGTVVEEGSFALTLHP